MTLIKQKMRQQAVGEPPLFLGSSVYFAIKDAVRAFRIENKRSANFAFDSPATPERICNACEHGMTDMVSHCYK